MCLNLAAIYEESLSNILHIVVIVVQIIVFIETDGVT